MILDQNLRVAFTGASGTGKSTLARYVQDLHDIHLNPIGSRSVSKEMGFDSPYDVDKAGRRAEFQRKLIHAKCRWEHEHFSFVTDRTPFDNLLYTMMHDVHAIDEETLNFAITSALRYTHVVYCPVDAFCNVGDDPARVDSRAYHRLYDMALSGMLNRYFPSTQTKLLTISGGDVEARKSELRAFLPPSIDF